MRYYIYLPRISPSTAIRPRQANWQDFLFTRLSGSRTFSSDFLERVLAGRYNNFELLSKVEVADKHHLLSMCVATIVDIIGDRLRYVYFMVKSQVLVNVFTSA